MTFVYFLLICAGLVLLWELAKEARRQWLLRRENRLPEAGSMQWLRSPRAVNSNPPPNHPRPANYPVAPPPTEP